MVDDLTIKYLGGKLLISNKLGLDARLSKLVKRISRYQVIS